jgi:hypothetical protein
VKTADKTMMSHSWSEGMLGGFKGSLQFLGESMTLRRPIRGVRSGPTFDR